MRSARARTSARLAVLGGVLGHVDAALVVGDHQVGEQLVGGRPRGGQQLVELVLGGHAGHAVQRDGLVHPGHRLAGLVGRPLPGVEEQADHVAVLELLVVDDRLGDRAQHGVLLGGGLLQVDEGHAHGLVVVGAHVLQEADVDRVGRRPLAAAEQGVARGRPRGRARRGSEHEQPPRTVPPRVQPGGLFGCGRGARRVLLGRGRSACVGVYVDVHPYRLPPRRVEATLAGAAGRHGYAAAVITAFVLINAEQQRIADLAEELADVEGVYEVYSVAGDVDIVAVVRVRDHDDLAEVVTKRMSRLAGIVDTNTLLAFRAYSRHDLDAMFSLGT